MCFVQLSKEHLFFGVYLNKVSLALDPANPGKGRHLADSVNTTPLAAKHSKLKSSPQTTTDSRVA